MSAYEVLDCTLRDGGYYTNWDFDPALVTSYLETMADLPVSTIELGYRSEPKTGYIGKFFFLNAEVLARSCAILRDDQKLAIMLNYKDVNIDTVAALLASARPHVDIIRFACPPDGLNECIEIARIVAQGGFEVAINVMYLTRYIDDVSMLAPLAGAGDVVQYVSLVDSYGGCFPTDVAKAIKATCALLPQKVGFHGHDNVCMAFANSVAAIEAGAAIVDATISGMGRGAGNLKTELILSYRDRTHATGMRYAKLSNLLTRFEAMQATYGWGSNLAYMISGFGNLPQADVMDWLGTRRYSLDAIVAALQHQGGTALDETPYDNLASWEHAKATASRNVVIIGGGPSIVDNAQAIQSMARMRGDILIHSTSRHATLFADFEGVQLYCLPGQELARIGDDKRLGMFAGRSCAVVPAGARFANSVPSSAQVYEVDNLLTPGSEPKKLGPVTDEPPLALALSAARTLGAGQIFIAGFDGYEHASLSDQQNALDVQNAIDQARATWPEWEIVSLTPTLYNVGAKSVHEMIQLAEAKIEPVNELEQRSAA